MRDDARTIARSINCRTSRQSNALIFCLFFLSVYFITVTINAHSAEPPTAIKSEPRTLIIANSKAWKPFSYLDDNGEPSGLLIDLWKEFAKVNRIRVEFVLTDWQESLDNLKHGKADIHAGLLWSTERAEFFDYGDSLAKLDGQIFVEQSLLSMNIESVLQSETLGVIKGSYEDSFVKGEFPYAKVRLFNNNEQMISAVLNGGLNVFIADFQVANFYLYTANQQNAFSPARHVYTSSVKPAVIKGNKVLLDLIKDGFNRVEQDELNRIQRKWLHIETVYPNYLVPLMMTLLLSMIVLYIIQLKRTVLHRTKALYRANKELQLLASQDGLTGINNRRNFIHEFERRNRQRSNSLTLLLFDIDRFKGVNDRFGHLVGDQTIQAIVKRVNSILSQEAIFGRIGGEEFCVFMTGLDEHEAVQFATNIQRCISKSKVMTDAGELAISVSLGAVYSCKKELDCKELLHTADQLMYQAKSRGRNCFEFESV
ncbi:sensor domain-containing diguanylate cyclase [uncultured Shewanella sp.]|uniref:transporter substrate-binding domain-containing diguanylate cyclase n=1 Tax=uncultured Shewanella sp. TaxID=173975 RepID=UPI0026220BD8|nr:sensor domain-containing diguanylate cyclase [uncultured Shewanella sp.]